MLPNLVRVCIVQRGGAVRLLGLAPDHCLLVPFHLGLPPLGLAPGRARCQPTGLLVGTLFLICKELSYCCVLTCCGGEEEGQEERQRKVSGGTYKGTNLIMRSPTSRPHLNLSNSQRPYLLIASPSGLGIQHMNLGVDTIQPVATIHVFIIYLFIYFRAVPVAYGSSQSRGQIRATAITPHRQQCQI